MDIFSLSTTFGPLAWYLTGILLFFVFEYVIPFRPATLSRLQRWRINFTMNFCNVLLVDLFFVALLKRSALFSPEHALDLFGQAGLNTFWRVTVTVLVLDLAMYVWHRMNHAVPLLWRFHRVHHTDLNVDVSSAARFHFGEVTGSTVITYTMMLFLGATILEVRLFQAVLFLMAQFGHSNIRLSRAAEKLFLFLIVTPAMHRVHHSNDKDQTESNYGTIFSFWDRMFGTYTGCADQSKIVFGLKEFSNPKELMLFKLLALPFRRDTVYKPEKENLQEEP